MSKIILYAHGGSGNHGCEAIVRSTAEMLRDYEKILISSAPEEDTLYRIGGLFRLVKDIQPYQKASPDFIAAYLALKLRHNYIPLDKLDYKKSASEAKKGDIALSVGGDNYCYADVRKYTMLHDLFLDRGAKTVLWGCSVEPELLSRENIAEDIAKYSLITARETISYEALKKVNPNTVLVSDPAFTLQTVVPELPTGFEAGNTVGINLSPLVKNSEKISGITVSNYKKLISYIIENTDMKIALIPHVIWEDNDDREALAELKSFFPEESRLITIPDMGCRELKGIISKCRFFVGARTHATIAAYSSCVPTLVVGYSVKARGIARDIFGDETGYVLPVQELQRESDLTDAFLGIAKREKEIKEHLQSVMPGYRERALCSKKINELIERLEISC